MKRMVAGIVLALAYTVWIVWLFSLELKYHNIHWAIHNISYGIFIPEMLVVYALSAWLIWMGTKAIKRSKSSATLGIMR